MSSDQDDRDGIRVERRAGRDRFGSWPWLLVALVVIGSASYLLVHRARSDGTAVAAVPSGTDDAPASSVAGAAVDPLAPAKTNVRYRARVASADGQDPTADLSDVLPAGDAPTMSEVIDGLHDAGIHTGLGAFPKPGTSPPLVGLAVPEDYPLPDGYVRHYQATDDGQRIEPILMFAPDAAFVDASGHAVPLPSNLVVPPDMAPAGMPIRYIRIPPALANGGGSP